MLCWVAAWRGRSAGGGGGRVRGPGDGARSMARASPARTPEFHI